MWHVPDEIAYCCIAAVLVTEFCGGGNVFNGRWFKEGKNTKALNTKRLLTELVEGVKYCHSMVRHSHTPSRGATWMDGFLLIRPSRFHVLNFGCAVRGPGCCPP